MSKPALLHERFVPMETLGVPPQGRVEHFANYWWIYDPSLGLLWVYCGAPGYKPQCNRNHRIAEMIRDASYPELELIQVPSVFVPTDSDGRFVLPTEE